RQVADRLLLPEPPVEPRGGGAQPAARLGVRDRDRCRGRRPAHVAAGTDSSADTTSTAGSSAGSSACTYFEPRISDAAAPMSDIAIATEKTTTSPWWNGPEI